MTHPAAETGGAIELLPRAPGRSLPTPFRIRADLPTSAWHAQRARIADLLTRHGALLLRDSGIRSEAAFESFARALFERPIEYWDRATPRTQLSDCVYTATDYPPEHEIFLHNESSFATTWPTKLAFLCVEPARSGGETPIADVRRVYAHIPSRIRKRFAETGVRYVRNFGHRLFGLSWRETFQTADRAELERSCRAAGIQLEWLDESRLRTSQIRPAQLRHPRTGEMVWFNHAAVLHVTTLDTRVRNTLERMFGEEFLPHNTYFGDGTPIEPETLDAIRGAYEREAVSFEWKAGDVLLLDNLLVAHGRRPFAGPRKVWVAMGDPMRWSDVSEST